MKLIPAIKLFVRLLRTDSYQETFIRREFQALGYKAPEEEEEGPNKWIQENVLEIAEVFASQGHSGSLQRTASTCLKRFCVTSRSARSLVKTGSGTKSAKASGKTIAAATCSRTRRPSAGKPTTSTARFSASGASAISNRTSRGIPGSTVFKRATPAAPAASRSRSPTLRPESTLTFLLALM